MAEPGDNSFSIPAFRGQAAVFSKDKGARRERESVAAKESERWGGGSAGFHRLKYAVTSTGRLMTPTRMIQPHAARTCCAVVEPARTKRKANLARPAQGPRPLVTFPILLGTPLPGQSCRPRGTPCAPSTPSPLPAYAHFSAFPPRERAAPLFFLFSLSFFPKCRGRSSIFRPWDRRVFVFRFFEGSRGVRYSGILGP